jgi:hypothetical protein
VAQLTAKHETIADHEVHHGRGTDAQPSSHERRQHRMSGDEYASIEQCGSGDGSMKSDPLPEQRPRRPPPRAAVMLGEDGAQRKVHLSGEEERNRIRQNGFPSVMRQRGQQP